VLTNMGGLQYGVFMNTKRDNCRCLLMWKEVTTGCLWKWEGFPRKRLR
jgi:hypothetical protein